MEEEEGEEDQNREACVLYVFLIISKKLVAEGRPGPIIDVFRGGCQKFNSA